MCMRMRVCTQAMWAAGKFCYYRNCKGASFCCRTGSPVSATSSSGATSSRLSVKAPPSMIDGKFAGLAASKKLQAAMSTSTQSSKRDAAHGSSSLGLDGDMIVRQAFIQPPCAFGVHVYACRCIWCIWMCQCMYGCIWVCQCVV